MRKFLLVALIALMTSPALAAEPAKPAEKTAEKADVPQTAIAENVKVPDTSNILFFQNLRRIGSTIYYMGEALGLHGWLVVKDKQMQVLYTSPDQRAVMIGALLSAEGANISQQQILLLASSKPEIAEILKQGQGATVQLAEPREDNRKPPSADSGLPPSEQFYAALQKATQVTFGKSESPQLYMIMDVHCRFCHETWNKLQPLVDSGRLRLTMVPIAALGAQSASDAALWIAKNDPLDAWRKHVAGDELILKTGTANPEKERAITDNTLLVHKWGITQTPYLIYRGKEGKVRMVLGVPEDPATLLADIGAEKK